MFLRFPRGVVSINGKADESGGLHWYPLFRCPAFLGTANGAMWFGGTPTKPGSVAWRDDIIRPSRLAGLFGLVRTACTVL
jgi:hypothetical protein